MMIFMHSILPAEISRKNPAFSWLIAGVVALAVAGLGAIVLVVARTPALAKLPYFADLFHKTLVVHVDLSVLVWFLAFACMVFSLHVNRQEKRVMQLLEQGALWCFYLSMAAMTFSMFNENAEALMSNYIPVIQSRLFFLSLGLLFSGMLLMLFYYFLNVKLPKAAVEFGVYSAAIITLIALACFAASYRLLPAVMEGQQYYEMLFWAGGHVLQFTHTQMQMLSWLLLSTLLYASFRINAKLLKALFVVNLAASFFALAAFRYDITSAEFRQFYTELMISMNGAATMILFLFMLRAWVKYKLEDNSQRALRSSLVMSLILFAAGGVIGLAIQGQNVTIPAHYHGAIVSVTLAFMGAAYALLPRFGALPVAHTRMAFWQPIVYGGGQLLHISGLAWSGGYGVLRKTPGALEGGFTAAKAAMGLMGGGGFIAIIGGIMFVIVIARSVLAKPQEPSDFITHL